MVKYRKKSKAGTIVGVVLILVCIAACIGGLVYLSRNDVPFVDDLYTNQVMRDVMFDGDPLSSALRGLHFENASVHRISLVEGADFVDLSVRIVPHPGFDFEYKKSGVDCAFQDLEELDLNVTPLPAGNGYSFSVDTFQTLLGGDVLLPIILPEGDMLDLVVVYKGAERRVSFSVPVMPQKIVIEGSVEF